MGTYDTLHDGPRVEQLKLWGKGLRHLHVGDRVGLPRGGLGPDGTYTVVMRTGGFVHVVDGVVEGWADEPGPGPQLTTRGLRYDPADWPGGPFGTSYVDPRTYYGAPEECPGALRPLRVVRESAGVVEPSPPTPARLLDRLTAATTDDELRDGARALARAAADLPADVVADCLHLLAAALPQDEDDDVDEEPGWEELIHPAMQQRRSRVAARDGVLRRLGRFGELDLEGAAEAAVARHGAAVLPAVPLRFWGRDVVVTELAEPLLAPVMGQEFTPAERAVLLYALLDEPGSLPDLRPEALRAALARALR
ncbi:hypothetical protein SAMN05660485_03690 [Blastococcus fimeti]|nr:hypothetical protein SAMN05660485_03690 [Blastococcus fimeti]